MSKAGRYSKKPQSVNDNIYYYESSDGISVHSWDEHDNLITHFVLPWRLLVTSVERHMYVNNSKLTIPTTQPQKPKGPTMLSNLNTTTDLGMWLLFVVVGVLLFAAVMDFFFPHKK